MNRQKALNLIYPLQNFKRSRQKNSNNTDESDIKILTEKGNVSAEILTYEDKKQEYEAYLKDYDIKIITVP